MTRRSTIQSTTMDPISSPSIWRSSINQCSFDNLSPADSIRRSALTNVVISAQQAHANNNNIQNHISNSARTASVNTQISSSKLTNSTVANVSARRSKIANSTLVNVASSQRLHATDSHLQDVKSTRRSVVKNSAVTGHSSLSRSKVHGSVVDESSLRRSKVENARVEHSRLKRSALRDCDVSNCIIVRSSFKGMVLRNGVWKNGQLVGRIGATEVVALGRDGKKMMGDVDIEKLAAQDREVWMQNELDSDCSDKEDELSDREDKRPLDPPPPYSA